MTTSFNYISLRTAALIAGFATLIMVACAPFAELYAYPKLVTTGNGAETVKNIIAHKTLFAALIMGYTITFTCDIVAAWALYILLKPVNHYLSALTALFRLTFAVISVIALLNLINTFRMTTVSDYMALFNQNQLQAQVMLSLSAFRYGFHFALIFFGIHLWLLGYLVWKSKYIPWVLGLLLVIAGIGYFGTSIQPYLFPAVNVSLASYTFYGELLFMLWLLIKGWNIQDIPRSNA